MAYTVLDVSAFNNITDYNSAISELSGVILRVGYRGYGSSGTLCKDSKFNQHYNGFLGKIPIGVYFLSQAINELEAKAEADYIYNIIKNLDIKFPIYINSGWSNNDHNGRADNLTIEQRSIVINTFCDRCRELGYKSGIYASDSWFKYQLDITTISSHVDSFWVAKYSSYKPTDIMSYDAWQYTISGKILGYSGTVNLSYFYKKVWEQDVSSYEKNISEYSYNISETSFIYNGKQQNPIVDIPDLILDVDYTVTTQTSIDAGTYTVILKGINNYNGKVDINYKINPAKLNNDLEIKLEYDSYIYTGCEIKPKIISIKNNIDDLILNKDYTVSYRDNINIEYGKVIIIGKSNFSGTAIKTFNIIKKPLFDVGMYLEDYIYKYTGSEIKPKVYINDNILKEGIDYKIEYFNNINPGYKEAVVKIIGINNCFGEIEDKFSISKMLISDCEVTLSKYQYTYNGKEYKPSVKVIDSTLNNIIITDYTINYINNINAGTAKVKITGEGNYSGEKEISFTINPKGINGLEPTLEYYECEFTGTYIKPKAFLSNLIYNKDYTTIYVDNINIGTAGVVLKGINNYIGQVSAMFNINYRDISTVKAEYNSTILNLYTETYKLEENKDYIIIEKNTEYIDDFLLVSFEIKGLRGFSGSYMFRFITILSDYDTEYDSEDYDFCLLEDIDTIKTINQRQTTYSVFRGYNYDDGIFNFGDIDEQDETAEGNYDFGDLDEGIDNDTVANDDYDFNELAGDATEESFISGTEYNLDNIPLYYNYCFNISYKKISGTYYIYNSKIINNRIRVCKYDSGIEVPCSYSGWVNTEDLINSNKISVGDLVEVTGKMYEFANGYGGYTEYEKEPFYITEIISDSEYIYPYAISRSPRSSKLGFVNKDSIKILANN